MVWHYGKQYGSSSKLENKISIWSNNPNSWYIPQRIESRVLERELYTQVHSNFIQNSQKVEATQVFNRWVDKQDVVYAHNRILFNLKKQRNSFFNWRIIALQCWVDFFCITMRISHNYLYIYPPSLASFLPTPHPTHLGHHRAPGWAPCIYFLSILHFIFPLVIYFTHSSVYM